MATLTDRQLSALKFIAEAIAKNSLPPTLREIGEHLGIRENVACGVVAMGFGGIVCVSGGVATEVKIEGAP